MRKNIQPVSTPLGVITSVEVSDLYLKENTINYQLSFNGANGQISAVREELNEADYTEWCETGAADSNAGFILNKVVAARGLTVVG